MCVQEEMTKDAKEQKTSTKNQIDKEKALIQKYKKNIKLKFTQMYLVQIPQEQLLDLVLMVSKYTLLILLTKNY